MSENYDGMTAGQLLWHLNIVLRFWKLDSTEKDRDPLHRIQAIYDKYRSYVNDYEHARTPWSHAKLKRERKKIWRALRLPAISDRCSGLLYAIVCQYRSLRLSFRLRCINEEALQRRKRRFIGTAHNDP